MPSHLTAEKEWIVIADPHLGTHDGDIEAMIKLICKLEPETQSLLFLGDLFHVWAGPEKFHTHIVKRLMACLWAFRERGGSSHLVVGNRDAFFQQKKSTDPIFQRLPFEVIAPDFDKIKTSHGLILAHHGDLVNQEDKAYLRWRKVIRSPWFRLGFNLMPGRVAQQVMFKLESKLNETNLDYKLEFPEQQWQNFIQRIEQENTPKLLLIGHFHPTDARQDQVNGMTAVVVPGWLDKRRYIKINLDLSYETLDFLA